MATLNSTWEERTWHSPNITTAVPERMTLIKYWEDSRRCNMKEQLDAIKQTCAFCKKLGNDLKVCARCKGPRYCSVVCQEGDWAEHKRVCQKRANLADPITADANDA